MKFVILRKILKSQTLGSEFNFMHFPTLIYDRNYQFLDHSDQSLKARRENKLGVTSSRVTRAFAEKSWWAWR